jgi:nitrate reductase NapE component
LNRDDSCVVLSAPKVTNKTNKQKKKQLNFVFEFVCLLLFVSFGFVNGFSFLFLLFQSREFEIGRTSIIPGLLKSLRTNRSASLPLRLFQIDDVLLRGTVMHTDVVKKR